MLRLPGQPGSPLVQPGQVIEGQNPEEQEESKCHHQVARCCPPFSSPDTGAGSASHLGPSGKGHAHQNPEGKMVSQLETHQGLTLGRRSVN